jgi:protein-tyrosine-phosphatase
MSIEVSSGRSAVESGSTADLARRAARHAALSDPSRLRIVDLLTLGDLSPGEIHRILGLPQNLVSHHLNTLEAEGFITRSRSEADKRRSYVQLATEAFDGLVPGATGTARRVVFVCTANSARSQLADALWARSSSIPSASAGTHPAAAVAPGALAAADRHALELDAAVRPRSVDDVLGDGDYVVTVCDAAHEELVTGGAVHWSVPDPVRAGTDAAFDEAVRDLSRRVTTLAHRLTAA